MLQIIVILTTSFIVVPLIELASNESIQRLGKILVYALALLFVVYELLVTKAV